MQPKPSKDGGWLQLERETERERNGRISESPQRIVADRRAQ